MSILSAGIYQCDVIRGDGDKNVQTAFNGISRLIRQGAELLVLPEMWSSGFDYSALAKHAARTPEILAALSGTAAKNAVIIAGSLPEADGEKIYNTLYVVDKKGEIAGKYRKTHLFPLIEEDKYFCGGDRPVVCETDCGRLGLMTCYDLRFPEFCRSLAIKGAEIVVISAQWPASRIHLWDTLLAARAIENQLFLVAANRYGAEDGLAFNGHSQIVSPTGEVLFLAASADMTAAASIDLKEIERFRSQFNCLGQRIPAVYGL